MFLEDTWLKPTAKFVVSLGISVVPIALVSVRLVSFGFGRLAQCWEELTVLVPMVFCHHVVQRTGRRLGRAELYLTWWQVLQSHHYEAYLSFTNLQRYNQSTSRPAFS